MSLPDKATKRVRLQGPSRLRKLVAGMGPVGRRRKTSRVPANARQSRTRTRLVPAKLGARQYRQHYMPICRECV